MNDTTTLPDPRAADCDSGMSERETYIVGLHALATLLTTHPELPLPREINVWEDGSGRQIRWSLWGDDAREAMTTVRRTLGGRWDKQPEGSYFYLNGRWGEFGIEMVSQRSRVCTRKVVGTREITETVPDPEAPDTRPLIEVTRTVEDVEWDCGPILADRDEPAQAVAS